MLVTNVKIKQLSWIIDAKGCVWLLVIAVLNTPSYIIENRVVRKNQDYVYGAWKYKVLSIKLLQGEKHLGEKTVGKGWVI